MQNGFSYSVSQNRRKGTKKNGNMQENKENICICQKKAVPLPSQKGVESIRLPSPVRT
jgi:hypothetical protein